MPLVTSRSGVSRAYASRMCTARVRHGGRQLKQGAASQITRSRVWNSCGKPSISCLAMLPGVREKGGRSAFLQYGPHTVNEDVAKIAVEAQPRGGIEYCPMLWLRYTIQISSCEPFILRSTFFFRRLTICLSKGSYR